MLFSSDFALSCNLSFIIPPLPPALLVDGADSELDKTDWGTAVDCFVCSVTDALSISRDAEPGWTSTGDAGDPRPEPGGDEDDDEEEEADDDDEVDDDEVDDDDDDDVDFDDGADDKDFE